MNDVSQNDLLSIFKNAEKINTLKT